MAMRCESEQVKLKCNYHPMSIIQFGSGVFNNQSKHRQSGTFPAFNKFHVQQSQAQIDIHLMFT